MGVEVVLRFSASCARCNKLLRVGQTAFHDASRHRLVWCAEHPPDNAELRQLANLRLVAPKGSGKATARSYATSGTPFKGLRTFTVDA